MNLSHPAFDVFGENEGRILYRLSVLGDGTTGRRLHLLAGVASLRTTQTILERFTRIGLVNMRPVGSSNEYSLNRGHVLWEPILRVLESPAIVETHIAQILSTVFGEHLIAAALYGSFARGEAETGSDIDILIVHADDDPAIGLADLIDDANERIRVLTGNDAQLLPVSRSELRNLVTHADPLVDSLRADARSLVEGFDLHGILHRDLAH